MSNLGLAVSVLKSCAKLGVSEVVLCAGARNAPLVEALAKARGVKTYSFFEERSAAFFALGRIQALGRPVAVVTTSGTAVAELLPAAVEAFYQGLPLILVTADRPRSHRGSGSPQTIEQPGIFSSYVERLWDIEGAFSGDFEASGRAPLHVNVSFTEPLLDEPVFAWDWPVLKTSRPISPRDISETLVKQRRPLVIVGGLPREESEKVLSLLKIWQRPTYLESCSQIRGLWPDALRVPEFDGLEFDSVVHIGAVPTLRFWRDLENSSVPVYHFSHLPFSGLPRSRAVWPLEALRDFKFDPWEPDERLSLRARKLDELLDRYPKSEPGWVRWLSAQMPEGARLFLGNSLPIREWDFAALPSGHFAVSANRGVNGIDGLISTFLGFAEPQKSNWALLGDLSALYDLSGPWALRERPLAETNIVIINNGGGKIFQRIFNNPMFENRHQLHFEHWSKMWELNYLRLDQPISLDVAKTPRVIEIIPDESSTEKFWQEWENK